MRHHIHLPGTMDRRKLVGRAVPSAPLPSWPRRLRNAVKALARHLRARFKGAETHVPDAVFFARAVQCGNCEWFRHADQTCAACGCRLAGRRLHKARLATEICPKGKWSQ